MRRAGRCYRPEVLRALAETGKSNTVRVMEFMKIDGAEIAFHLAGSGPPLLAPECNHTWSPDTPSRVRSGRGWLINWPNAARWQQLPQEAFPCSVTTESPPETSTPRWWNESRIKRTGHDITNGFTCGQVRNSIETSPWSRRTPWSIKYPVHSSVFGVPKIRMPSEWSCPPQELAEGLTRRGVHWKEYEGYDHEGLNSQLQIAWPDTEKWLLEQAANNDSEPLWRQGSTALFST